MKINLKIPKELKDAVISVPNKKAEDTVFSLSPEEDKDKYKDFIKNIYYDSHSLFWIWNDEIKTWEMKDETDILNLFEDNGEETTKQKTKTKILNISRQQGRRNKPEELPKDSICFKNCIYDLKNKKIIPISSDYFITSPIPYELGENSETPTIDKLFNEWVGEEWKETLYEIIAYSCLKEQPLQTIFALTGGGSNGKGTFQNLIIKFLGKENCVSSNIKSLITRNFESSALYKKLLCVMGEADSSDLSNSNLIKQFTGEDLMRYEFKGKTTFSEESPTTFILATNSLPITPDKSIGFYRRWLTIDFPNQFKVKRKLLSQIPEEEFQNLACKIIGIATRLLEQEEFTNDGGFEDRRKRYEERSNPLFQFISDYCVEEPTKVIKLKEFSDILKKYLQEKKLRALNVNKVGKLLRDEGFEIQGRDFRGESGEIVEKSKAILGLCFHRGIYSIYGKKVVSVVMTKLPELPEFDIYSNNHWFEYYSSQIEIEILKLPELPEFDIYCETPIKSVEDTLCFKCDKVPGNINIGDQDKWYCKNCAQEVVSQR